MTITGCGVGESSVRQPQFRAAVCDLQLHGNDGFGSFRAERTGYPCELNQLIGDEAKKSTVVRMALRHGLRFVLELRLKEKCRVDLGPHEHGAGSCEPSIEPVGPRLVKHGRRLRKGVLGDQVKWPRRKVGYANRSHTGVHERAPVELHRTMYGVSGPGAMFNSNPKATSVQRSCVPNIDHLAVYVRDSCVT